ncbi:MAG: bifunctional riboflavin kinase/FAD synthetase [Thiotrichaceae bacterium]
MKLIRGTTPCNSQHKACVATIGNFDGLHKGHRKIIEQVKAEGRRLNCLTSVISFEPLPTEFFSQKFHKDLPGRIYPYRDKARILNSLGIDEFVCLNFTQVLSEMEPEDFIKEILLERLNIKYLVIGDDFRFGKQRRGDFEMLSRVGKQFGMEVSNTATIQQNGKRVSSTLVRKHLSKGDVFAANELLVDKYQLSGRVRHGDKRGRTIGFPTLNQSLPEDIVAARGAYAVKVHGLSEKALIGVANIGNRPTVSGLETRLETHIFDFDQEVYGKKVCVELVQFLRPEQKFESFDDLMLQIKKDSKKAREVLA